MLWWSKEGCLDTFGKPTSQAFCWALLEPYLFTSHRTLCLEEWSWAWLHSWLWLVCLVVQGTYILYLRDLPNICAASWNWKSFWSCLLNFFSYLLGQTGQKWQPSMQWMFGKQSAIWRYSSVFWNSALSFTWQKKHLGKMAWGLEKRRLILSKTKRSLIRWKYLSLVCFSLFSMACHLMVLNLY